MSASAFAAQRTVDRYFDAYADYWRAVYGRDDLQGLIYRRRMQTVADWARELCPAPGAAALDAGCGAGLMVVELARSGFAVTGTDSSPRMVRSASEFVAEQGLARRVQLRQTDVHRLPFGDREFELAVALGLLPWLHNPTRAVAELARVLAPSGCIILTADNSLYLNRLVAQSENLLVWPLRQVKRRLFSRRRASSQGVEVHRYMPREVDEMLVAAGIEVVRRTTIGYGPFTVRGHPLPDSVGRWMHERLERAAVDRPRLRATGWHYVVAGRKCA